jgi:hypothetical protein
MVERGWGDGRNETDFAKKEKKKKRGTSLF